MDDTPAAVLDFWFGPVLGDGTAEDEAALKTQQKIWFGGGPKVDHDIRARFMPLVEQLGRGHAKEWAQRGLKERLAAVIVLDQFSRSIYRGAPQSFANDPLARTLAREAIDEGADLKLAPLERWFLYMPLEHSEAVHDQRDSVARFEALEQDAPPALKPMISYALDYARRHADVIDRFGRFPHRNAILGRETTPSEAEFLKRNPGF